MRTEPEVIVRRNWTRAWEDGRRQAYQLVTSMAVVDEWQAGTFPNQDQALTLLVDIPLVPVEPAIIEIVEAYIQRIVTPRDPRGDALHLSLASYQWNVQHPAIAHKFGHTRRINVLLGLSALMLVTPLELLA